MALHLDPHALLGVLHAFYLEHEYCGELDTGIGDYCG